MGNEKVAFYIRLSKSDMEVAKGTKDESNSITGQRALLSAYLKEHEEIRSINTPQMLDEADRGAREMQMMPYYLYRQKNMAGNFENVGYAKHHSQ